MNSLQRSGTRFHIQTSRGALTAQSVLVGTSGYTGGVTKQLQKRIIPIGSFIIATERVSDELAHELDEAVDMTAERATALGGVALGTLRQGAAKTRLPEFPADAFTGAAVVEALAVRFAQLAKTTREAIDTADSLGDKSTADLFTEVSRELDKGLWFLEAHLQA